MDVITITRIVFVTFFVVLGALGNGLVLLIYGRNKRMPARWFVVILAVTDFYSSVVLMPQVLVVMETDFEHVTAVEIVITQVLIVELSYILVTMTMALDRVIAVFAPFTYTNNRRRLITVMCACACVLFVLTLCSSTAIMTTHDDTVVLLRQIRSRTFMTIYAIGLVVVTCVYPVIAWKLRNQGRQIRPYNNQRRATVVQVARTNNADQAVMTSQTQERKRASDSQRRTLRANFIAWV